MLALVGCSEAEPSPLATSPSPEATAQETTAVMPDDLLDRVKRHVATTEEVEVARVAVHRVERRTWPDGALGCPEPGGVYTQAVETGYQVILGIADRRFDYRVTDRGTLRRCEPPLRPRTGRNALAPP